MNNQFALLIDPACGMAGDMFSAALLSLGVPPEIIIGAMEMAALQLGKISITPEWIPATEATAVKLHIRLESYQDHLAAGAARRFLEEAIKISKLEGGYADFARRTLNILIEAEREVHKDKRMPVATLDHAETHRQMIPHDHGEEVMLHEAQDILIDVIGAAAGLQYLQIELNRALCLSPVRVGGGYIVFSHGRLAVPAPAVQAILDKYGLPYAGGPVEKELLTPTGASLLAGLQPEFRPRNGTSPKLSKAGIGRGLRSMEPPGDLYLGLL